MKASKKQSKPQARGRSLHPVVGLMPDECQRLQMRLNSAWASVRRIFEDLDWAERQPEPDRTQKLKTIIRLGLKHIKPNKPLSGAEAASGSVYARKDGST